MVSSMGLGSTGDCSQLMLDETGDSRHATWAVTLSRKSGTVCGLVRSVDTVLLCLQSFFTKEVVILVGMQGRTHLPKLLEEECLHV